MSDAAFTHDVFLSHSPKDKAVVRAVAERLVAVRKHLKVWFDEWEIKPGDSVPAKIEEGLEHSRVLVLCGSPLSVGLAFGRTALPRRILMPGSFRRVGFTIDCEATKVTRRNGNMCGRIRFGTD